MTNTSKSLAKDNMVRIDFFFMMQSTIIFYDERVVCIGRFRFCFGFDG